MTSPAREVVADVPCQECGYNLRGLCTDGRCPECGSSIRSSLRAPVTLAMAHGPWLKQIRSGAWQLAAAYATAGMVPPLNVLVHDRFALFPLNLALLAAAFLLLLIGSICFSRPEPYIGSAGDLSRFRLGVLLCAWAIPVVSLFVIGANGSTAEFAVLALSLAILGHQASVVLLTCRLARRTRARLLAKLGTPGAVIMLCLWVTTWLGFLAQSQLTAWAYLVLAPTIPIGCVVWFLLCAPKAGTTSPYA